MKNSLPFLLICLTMISACSKPPAKKIAFVSEQTGYPTIHIMDEDGSNIVTISNVTSYDFNPVFSPDGSKIAFYSDANILIVDLAGNIIGRFSSNNNISAMPFWSPDNQYIAFHSTIDGNFEIYKMREDGSDILRLTDDPARDDSCPIFSPDGEYIAFASTGELGQFELYVVRSDGSEVRRLGPGTINFCPFYTWSPDSKFIAAVASRVLYVVNVARADELQVIEECASPSISWSPDGEKLAFASNFCTNDHYKTEVFTISPNGDNRTRLTNNNKADFYPVWSPDGQRIAYVSEERDGNRQIYVMNSDGSEPVNLTNNNTSNYMPVWQP